MSTSILPELRALAESDSATLEHLEKLRAHLKLAIAALEAPLDPRDPWRDERRLFGVNYAKVTRITSRETKLEVSCAGVFDKDGVGELIAALRNAAHVEDRPLLSVEECEHLRGVLRYFQEVAGGGGTLPADARDARRYRRLRILGAAIPQQASGLDTNHGKVLRFQNLDDTLDQDLRREPSRGEAKEGGSEIDWNQQAKDVLGKLLTLHAFGKV